MKSLEIKDITSQDKKGVIFYAHDHITKCAVQIRRFFPFGPHGGGMSSEEAAGYHAAAKVMVGKSFPSFRSILSSGIDPIDDIPFLVAECVGGNSLNEYVNRDSLDAGQANEVLRRAIETSLFLSPLVGEQGLWVDTELETIWVSEGEENRRYVFWISPFKWLGADADSKKLSPLADLGERLMGWKGKLYGDQAGNGLGACLKWMRNNSEASLSEALVQLESCMGGGDPVELPKLILLENDSFRSPPSAQVVAPLQTVLRPVMAPISLEKGSSNIKFWVVGILFSLVLIVAGFWVQARNRQIVLEDAIALKLEQEEKARIEAKRASDLAAAKKLMEARKIQAKALEKPSSIRVEDQAIENSTSNEKSLPAVSSTPKLVTEFTPDDSEKMKQMDAFSEANISGVVKKIRKSYSGKSIYLEFSDPLDKDQIHVVIHQSSFEGNFDVEEFESYLGKNLRFKGEIFREITKRQYVRISSPKQIEILP